MAMRRKCRFGFACLLASVLGIAPLHGNDITVEPTSPGVVDNGTCSLIEALLNANTSTPGGQVHDDCAAGDPNDGIEDVVILPPGLGTITLTAPFGSAWGPIGLPTITQQSVRIEGN